MASSLLSRLIRCPSTQKGSPLLHSYSLAGALLLLLVPFPTLVASTPPASLLLLFLILTPAPFLVPVHVSWSSPPLIPFLHASSVPAPSPRSFFSLLHSSSPPFFPSFSLSSPFSPKNTGHGLPGGLRVAAPFHRLRGTRHSLPSCTGAQ
jgi:hypothetical protein